MRYLNFSEISFSIFASLLFGLVASLFYVILQTFVYTIERFIFLPKRIVICSKNFSALKNAKTIDCTVNGAGAKIKLFVSDFLYVLFLGIGSLLLLYIVCDGAFRLYPLAISGFVNFVFGKHVGKRLERLIESALGALYLCITVSLAFVILLLRKLVSAAVKIFMPLYDVLRNFIKAKNSKKSKKIKS